MAAELLTKPAYL
jgi:amino acid permease